MSSVLEPTPKEFRAVMERVLDFSETVLARGAGARASDSSRIDEMLTRLDEKEPARADLDELLTTLAAAAATGSDHLHPGFLAYVPIAGAPVSAVADYLAALLNPYVGVQWDSPAMVQLEWNALRWMSRLFGYPEQARGVFTSGGSLANFTAVVTARHARLGNNYAQGRIFMSDQTHHSIERAALISGVKPECIVTVPTDANLRLDVGALDEALTDAGTSDATAIPRHSKCRNDEHRRRRSDSGNRGPCPSPRRLGPCRWRLRRCLRAYPARSEDSAGNRPGRLDHA